MKTQKEAADELARVVRAYLGRWSAGEARYRALSRALDAYEASLEPPLDLATIMDEEPARPREGQRACLECDQPFWPRHAEHVFCRARCRVTYNNRRNNPLRDRRRYRRAGSSGA